MTNQNAKLQAELIAARNERDAARMSCYRSEAGANDRSRKAESMYNATLTALSLALMDAGSGEWVCTRCCQIMPAAATPSVQSISQICDTCVISATV